MESNLVKWEKQGEMGKVFHFASVVRKQQNYAPEQPTYFIDIPLAKPFC